MIKKIYINENNNTDFGKTPEDFKNEKLDDIDFVMYRYVQDSRFGIKIVSDDEDGNYGVCYEGEVVTISFDINSNIANYVYTINDEGPYAHDSYEFISSDIMEFVDGMYDLEESYNDNTEEQELAEFLDFLKEDGIIVSNINRKFKQINVTNEKDLDTASFYLHDRDYFKKLSDFGWIVALPNKSLGKQLAKTLKMESSHDNYKTFDANDAKEAARQTFDHMYDKYIKTNQQISEFQMDAELDTPDFWKTFAHLCVRNNLEYYVVHKDKNFDDVYYEVELTDLYNSI